MVRKLVVTVVLMLAGVPAGAGDAGPEVAGSEVPLSLAAPEAPGTELVRPSLPMPPLPVLVTPPGPVDPLADDPTGLLRLFTRAVKERNYALAAAFALMFVTWVLRKKFPAINPKAVPLVSLFLGAVPSVALLLRNPNVTWDEILSALVVIWLMSAGAWESAAKQARDIVPWAKLNALIFRKPPAVPPAPEPPAPPKP